MLPNLLCFLSFWAFARAQTPIQTFWPGAAPLAVRSPYLNVWQTDINANDYPEFWVGSVLGWVGFIRVDGSTYRFLGNNYDMSSAVGACDVTYTEVTPTRTIQTVQAGPINVTLTFLSPIEPSDWVKQSMPFSYLAVEFASTDGKEHSVQIYSDISAEWASAAKGNTVQWSTSQTGKVVWHSVELQRLQPFIEAFEQASDGTAFYAMSLGSGQSTGWQTCQDTVCYEAFLSSGALSSKNDNDTFRAISNDLPVFAFSVDFGSVSATQEPVVWAVGYVRDPSVEYSLPGGVTTLHPYYTTQYSNVTDVVEAFVADYGNALSRAEELDAQVRQAAANVSPASQYWNMVSLAARQVFGALDLTAPGSDGTARFFMKDIGLSHRVNPVEGLYAALPLFLYFNSSMVKPLLVPLLEQQNSSSDPASYAASDIGASYPIASGATAAESEGVEQSANMLIMVLAHATRSGDSSLVKSYYTLLKTWADYLVSNALYPKDQASINSGESVSNSTNLAAKGILAIQAMSNISTLFGSDDDAEHYSSVASQYIGTWKALAISSDSSHILPTYGDDSTSWTLPYGLFPQSLLGFNLLEDSVMGSLTSYYKGLDYSYGPPIGSQNTTLGSAVWTALAVATFTDTTARQTMLGQLWKFASPDTLGTPLSSVYDVTNGKQINGTASPLLGALYAPLALSGGHLNSTQGAPGTSGSGTPGASGSLVAKHATPIGAIVGGVVGGVGGLLLILGLAAFFLRRKRRAPTLVQPYVSPLLHKKDSEATFAPSRLYLVRKPSDPRTTTGETSFIGGTPSSVVGPTAAYGSPSSVIVVGDPPSVIASSTAVTTPSSLPPPPLLGLTPTTATMTERSELNIASPASLLPPTETETTPPTSATMSPSSATISPTLVASSPRPEKQDVPMDSPMLNAASGLPGSDSRDRERDAELENLRNDMQELRQQLRRVVPVLERLEEPPEHDEPPPDYWAQ